MPGRTRHNSYTLALRVVAALLLAGGCVSSSQEAADARTNAPADGSTIDTGASLDWTACSIDVHQHLAANEAFDASAANFKTNVMPAARISKVLLMPPPQSYDPPAGTTSYTYNDPRQSTSLLDIATGDPGSFGVVAGAVSSIRSSTSPRSPVPS